MSSTISNPSYSSTTNLPATPRNTNCKLKSDPKITSTTPSIECKSSTTKSKSLPKFKKHFDTNRFKPLASFATPVDLETESHTEQRDSSNLDHMLEYDTTGMVLE
ncbi:hypothetical protein CDAR_283551 [Caerostris darwini]|uniref:Uncharacterized protein n=1 Tax=Caerostris darwini TaxID=1538125 RepID=A0AAV4P850_9ARAC|nr:hypothetical protein CDAR_283551 [Caerostris darwini]